MALLIHMLGLKLIHASNRDHRYDFMANRLALYNTPLCIRNCNRKILRNTGIQFTQILYPGWCHTVLGNKHWFILQGAEIIEHIDRKWKWNYSECLGVWSNSVSGVDADDHTTDWRNYYIGDPFCIYILHSVNNYHSGTMIKRAALPWPPKL